MTLDEFIRKYTGVTVGNTDVNTGQCVGLVAVWFDVMGEPHVWGNAKDLYANAPESSYAKGSSWPAPAGSAVVLNGTWGGGVGHTALSLGDGRLFEQNNPTGSKPKITNYGAKPNGYIGYILPKNYTGEQMIIQNADNWFARCDRTMQLIRGRACSREEFEKYAVGSEFLHWVESVSDDPEASANQDYANWGRTAKNDHWDQQIYDLQAKVAELQIELARPAAPAPELTLDSYTFGDLVTAAFKKLARIK